MPTTVIRGVKPNLPTCSRLERKKKRIPQPLTARVLPAIRSPLCSCVSRNHLCAGSVPRCGVCKGPARQSAGTRWSGHAAKSHLGLSRGYQAASYCQSSSGSSLREPQRFKKKINLNNKNPSDELQETNITTTRQPVEDRGDVRDAAQLLRA